MAKDLKLPNKAIYNPAFLSLPNEWDSSVSQIEMLTGMLYNINLIIQYLEDLQANYEEYTDNAINSLRDELTAKYDGIIADLRNHYDMALAELKTYIDTQDRYYYNILVSEIARIDTRMMQLLDYVNQNFDDIRKNHNSDVSEIYAVIERLRLSLLAYIDLNNESIKKWVEETYQDILDKVDEINEDGFRIYNPITGNKDHVGNTVNMVYEALRIHACTAQEFDDWMLIYDNDGESFRMLFLSALEFDIEGKRIMYAYIESLLNNPVNGEMTPHDVAIENVNIRGDPFILTANERDALGFDEMDYINTYSYTASFWDFNSIQIFDTPNTKTVGRTNYPSESTGFNRVYKLDAVYDHQTEIFETVERFMTAEEAEEYNQEHQTEIEDGTLVEKHEGDSFEPPEFVEQPYSPPRFENNPVVKGNDAVQVNVVIPKEMGLTRDELLQAIFSASIKRNVPFAIYETTQGISFYGDTNGIINIANTWTVTGTEEEPCTIEKVICEISVQKQPLKPYFIEGSDIPIPMIPSGVVTASQFDGWYDSSEPERDGTTFKLLSMSAYIFDTDSLGIMYPDLAISYTPTNVSRETLQFINSIMKKFNERR